MSTKLGNKKRKAPTESLKGLNGKRNVAVGSDDEDHEGDDELAFLNKGGLLDARQSDDESDEDEDEDDEDEEEEDSECDSDEDEGGGHQDSEDAIDSDEIPSENESSALRQTKAPSMAMRLREKSKDGQGSGEEDGGDVAHYSDLDEDLPPGTRVVTDSTGQLRYMYPEIVTNYDSDDSDAGDEGNTIGNIPLSTYDLFPHIGYDINGNKIMRPAAGKALDQLLDSIELPKGWTGLVDKNTGKELKLTDEEMRIVGMIQRGRVPAEEQGVVDKDGGGYDPYEPTVEWFTSKTEIMPLSSAPEPKRRFVPSKHEAKRVSCLAPCYNRITWLTLPRL